MSTESDFTEELRLASFERLQEVLDELFSNENLTAFAAVKDHTGRWVLSY